MTALNDAEGRHDLSIEAVLYVVLAVRYVSGRLPDPLIPTPNATTQERRAFQHFLDIRHPEIGDRFRAVREDLFRPNETPRLVTAGKIDDALVFAMVEWLSETQKPLGPALRDVSVCFERYARGVPPPAASGKRALRRRWSREKVYRFGDRKDPDGKLVPVGDHASKEDKVTAAMAHIDARMRSDLSEGVLRPGAERTQSADLPWASTGGAAQLSAGRDARREPPGLLDRAARRILTLDDLIQRKAGVTPFSLWFFPVHIMLAAVYVFVAFGVSWTVGGSGQLGSDFLVLPSERQIDHPTKSVLATERSAAVVAVVIVVFLLGLGLAFRANTAPPSRSERRPLAFVAVGSLASGAVLATFGVNPFFAVAHTLYFLGAGWAAHRLGWRSLVLAAPLICLVGPVTVAFVLSTLPFEVLAPAGILTAQAVLVCLVGARSGPRGGGGYIGVTIATTSFALVVINAVYFEGRHFQITPMAPAMTIFFVIFPIINGAFDHVSFFVTRRLAIDAARKILTGEIQSTRHLYLLSAAILDVVAAIVLLTCLFAALFLGIELYSDRVLGKGSSATILSFIEGFQQNIASDDGIFIAVMIATVLLPTAAHSTAILGGWLCDKLAGSRFERLGIHVVVFALTLALLFSVAVSATDLAFALLGDL